MTKKLLVSDLDGTIFDSDTPGYTLSEKLIQRVREFVSQGNIFTIATGRPETTTLPIVRMLGVNAPFIAYNGAVIFSTDGQILYSETFDLKPWLPFIHKIHKTGGNAIVYDKGIPTCFYYTHHIKRYEAKEKTICYEANQNIKEGNAQVNKILLIGDVSAIKEQWHKMDFESKKGFSYLVSEKDYFEIVKAGITKGSALKILKKIINEKDIKIAAIGNHLNDMEMLKEADIGAAVGNAEEDLKLAADIVTAGHFHEGVIELIDYISAVN